jgi:predicted transglutaminase-like cysteine proteinase
MHLMPALLLPNLAAMTPRWAGLRARAALALVLGLASLLCTLSPRAWDVDRMFAAAQALGPRALAGARALQVVLASVAGADEIERLQAVNQFFNSRVLFRDDQDVWGQIDYWASPLELLDKGRGDCEDYAMAKYFALLTTGMPESRLRMVYVRAQVGGVAQAHMVLAYYATPAAEPLILDNLLSEIRPAARRPDLAPVFSFNSEGLWQGVAGASAGDPQARLSRWRAVLTKARAEGFQ